MLQPLETAEGVEQGEGFFSGALDLLIRVSAVTSWRTCNKSFPVLVKRSLPLVLLILCSCAATNRGEGSYPAAQQQIIQTVETNDGQLSCDELLSAMRQMDRIAYGTPAPDDSTKNAMVSALTSGASLGFGFIPIPLVGSALGTLTGPFSIVAGSSGQQQKIDQQNRIIQAQQRKQHLVTLYDNKKCYETTGAPPPEPGAAS